MNEFPEQTRTRFVLVHPTADGVQCPQLKLSCGHSSGQCCGQCNGHWMVSTHGYDVDHVLQCPQLRETRPCTSLPHCVRYHWQVSTWSTCQFIDTDHHSDHCTDHGYRLRGTNGL